MGERWQMRVDVCVRFFWSPPTVPELPLPAAMSFSSVHFAEVNRMAETPAFLATCTLTCSGAAFDGFVFALFGVLF